jgi:hypothetical protein
MGEPKEITPMQAAIRELESSFAHADTEILTITELVAMNRTAKAAYRFAANVSLMDDETGEIEATAKQIKAHATIVTNSYFRALAEQSKVAALRAGISYTGLVQSHYRQMVAEWKYLLSNYPCEEAAAIVCSL